MKQTMKIMLPALVLVLALVVFTGASCNEDSSTEDNSTSDEATETTDEDFDFDQLCADTGSSTTTPHGTVVCGGIDSALLGTWKLKSQTVVGSSLRLEEGRTLTFYSGKSYMEDYSSEKLEKVTVNTSAGAASEQCKASGNNTGSYHVTFKINDDDSVNLFLEVDRDANLDPEGIKVTCDEGPAGTEVTSTVPSNPLGQGKTASSCDGNFPSGPCVRYGYTISGEGSILTITTIDGPSATYVFNKVS
ncbi:hypothetical protein KJ903_02645 [Patescibacteria group bacterium]|nr:hypothetical protein [Patescibacteria group bacterium]